MSEEIYVAIVSFNSLDCDEILSAIGREAIRKECETHFRNWAKSLAKSLAKKKKPIHWGGGYVKDGDMSWDLKINKPHYRTYPASQFEELKFSYPQQAEYLDSLYKPETKARAAWLIQQVSGNSATFGSSGSRYFYAKEELEKLGYVYSEGAWYPPEGIMV